MSGRQLRFREWVPTLWAVAVAVLTMAVFFPVLRNDFVRWDDHVVLLGNPHYRGLGGTQIRWMFTTRLLGHYMPVTWPSYGLDHTLWGMSPTAGVLTSAPRVDVTQPRRRAPTGRRSGSGYARARARG